MIPEKIDRYEIKGILGEGGMATVYRAYDPRFEREVALKMLHDRSLRDKDTRARFLREGRIVAKLDHPHIVPVYDIGEEEEKPYLVMRFMAGGSLSDWIRRGPISLARATDVIQQVSGALDEAHEHGVIHRDMKPGNIMLDQRGDVFLSDFGIVKSLDAKNKLTSTGTLLGTLAYMSPEQFKGQELDGRSDIYALGVVLFEMLTGQLPFVDDSAYALMMAHIEKPVPYITETRSDLPMACQEVINKAMAKNPDNRYATADEMYQDLKVVHLNSDFAQDASIPIPPSTIDTVQEPFPQREPDTQPKRQTTSEKIKMQVKRLPAWVRWGIVGVGMLLLFGVLFQAMAAPNLLSPTATATISAPTQFPTETAPPPNEVVADLSDPPTPTAVFDSIIVRDWDSSAVWQANNEVGRIPEDGKIPLSNETLLIQSNASPMELLLPDRTRLVLDSNTTISLNAVEEGAETAVLLEQGRLGIEPVGLPILISAPMDVQARTSSGLMGVTFNPDLETFDLDCLQGICELVRPGEEPLTVNEGENRQATPDNVQEPIPAQVAPFLDLFNRLSAPTPVPTATATLAEAPTQTATMTPLPTKESDEPFQSFILGQSASGKDLEMVQFGDGERIFVIVGGTHGGYAPNTIKLADEFITYYTENETAVPEDVTLYIISNFNPDAPQDPAELPGRLNANGVDLNRNWDCRWTENPIVLGNREMDAGGTAAESEPEVQALANFLKQQSPTAVIQLAAHGRNYGVASPGSCIDRTRVSVSLSKLYGTAAEYLFPDTDNDGLVEPDASLTGDMTNWLDSIDIPAMSILLPKYENTDFELNLAGLTVVLETYNGPDETLDLPSTESEASCVETAVINDSVYQKHQDDLGCIQNNIQQPTGAIQEFEKGTMIWRGDNEAVYLLYNNGKLDTYIVNEASDYGETDILKGAFGYVWHTKSGVSGKMGEPKSVEQVAGEFKLQDFENGTILKYDGINDYLLLFSNSTWESVSGS